MNREQRSKQANRVTMISLTVNVMLMFLKGIAGAVANSTALIADAVHSASDVLTTLVVFVGVRVSSRPADINHHYGHAKLESVAAKIVALVLAGTGVGIGWSAWGVLQGGDLESPTVFALIAAGVSILVKEGLFRYTFKKGTQIDSRAIIADAWHNRSDALSSVAALVGVAGARFGYSWADPVAGIIVAVLIIRVGGKLYLTSVGELVDEAPDRETMEKIAAITRNTRGVRSLNQVKGRKVGSNIHLDLSLCVDPEITVKAGHDIAVEVENNLQASISKTVDVMIHVNPCQNENYEKEQKCTKPCPYAQDGDST